MRRAKDLWMFRSGAPDDAPMEQHLTPIRELLASRREQLAEMRAIASVELRLGWFQGSSQGGFVLDADLIELLGTAGASIIVSVHGE
jgi:hypothetical protein